MNFENNKTNSDEHKIKLAFSEAKWQGELILIEWLKSSILPFCHCRNAGWQFCRRELHRHPQACKMNICRWKSGRQLTAEKFFVVAVTDRGANEKQSCCGDTEKQSCCCKCVPAAEATDICISTQIFAAADCGSLAVIAGGSSRQLKDQLPVYLSEASGRSRHCGVG